MQPGFVYNDGGRAEAGFKGHAGDCVVRAIAIASGRPYREIYREIAALQKRSRAADDRSPRTGVRTDTAAFKRYMKSQGFEWTPTMKIGSGTTVHLEAGELPAGRLVVIVSKHATAMIDGVINDTHDPRRNTLLVRPYDGKPLRAGETLGHGGVVISRVRRAVYGYWMLRNVA